MERTLKFHSTGWPGINESRPNRVYLRRIDWDDWFKYSTSFDVMVVDTDGTRHKIGETKIGKFGLLPAGRGDGEPGKSRLPGPPDSFRELPESYFSLGQDASFYEKLSEISADVRETVLRGLNDLAFDPELLTRAQNEDVTRVSLLRYVPLLTVQEQYARLARGGVRLTPYNLRVNLDYLGDRPVRFKVSPDSRPPTNIHVIIGRNGVGKSTFLNSLAMHLVKQGASGGPPSSEDSDETVANLVSVSFSAFDSFEPLTASRDRTKGLTYHYVGLKIKDDSERIKGPRAISAEMSKSARSCLQDSRRSRWVRALRLLESDPIFHATGIADAAERESEDDFLDLLTAKFKLLSSGHKLVLLTITRLVETVTEKSLVLLDEPEAHLHPPLLSAFLRALSDLLINRNGLAVVATHSPVVLQEVPKRCVWKFDRDGETTTFKRPRLETFGENVGTLTNEVFGLEVTSTGYHSMLLDIALNHRDSGYDAALDELNGQLGSEGRAILRGMIEAMRSSHVDR